MFFSHVFSTFLLFFLLLSQMSQNQCCRLAFHCIHDLFIFNFLFIMVQCFNLYVLLQCFFVHCFLFLFLFLFKSFYTFIIVSSYICSSNIKYYNYRLQDIFQKKNIYIILIIWMYTFMNDFTVCFVFFFFASFN